MLSCRDSVWRHLGPCYYYYGVELALGVCPQVFSELEDSDEESFESESSSDDESTSSSNLPACEDQDEEFDVLFEQ